MTTDEMVSLLEKLGIETGEVQGREVKARCPAHLARTGREDSHPSFSINASTGAFRCWSCHFKGNLQYLVSYIGGVDYEDVDKFIKDKEELSDLLARVDTEPEEDLIPTVLYESELALFTPPPTDILRGRGILPSVAARLGILYDPKKRSWIIPIRDPLTNALWGWQEKGITGRYFMNYPTGVKKGRTLFGYYQHMTVFTDEASLLLVESPLDVARLASVGIDFGVAAYGASLTKDQYELLNTDRKLYVALDNDEAGRNSTSEVGVWADKVNRPVWFFNYDHTDQKDVGGMSKDEIYTGIANARISLRKGAFQ